jgi:hypothetical protein
LGPDEFRAKRVALSEKAKKDAEKRLDLAVQTRNFEIELFWKRSLFFWGFIAAAFGGYAALRTIKSDLTLVIACFGAVCAFAWTLVTRGSKYWQESWEGKVDQYEKLVIGRFFAHEEPVQSHKGVWLRARRFSVSKISIGLSDYIFALWVALLSAEVFRKFLPASALPLFSEIGTSSFLLFSVVFCIFLFVYGHSSTRPDEVESKQEGKDIGDEPA